MEPSGAVAGESLADSIRAQLKHSNPSRERHAGSSINLQASMGHAKHAVMRESHQRLKNEKAAVTTFRASEHYAKLIGSFEERAASLQASTSPETFESRLGFYLKDRKLSGGKLSEKSDIVWEWDKNHDGKTAPRKQRRSSRGEIRGCHRLSCAPASLADVTSSLVTSIHTRLLVRSASCTPHFDPRACPPRSLHSSTLFHTLPHSSTLRACPPHSFDPAPALRTSQDPARRAPCGRHVHGRETSPPLAPAFGHLLGNLRR